MDVRKIVWTRVAIDQRDSIFRYWNKRNKSTNYSKKLNLGIKERLKLLQSMPKLGMKTNLKNHNVLFYSYFGIHYKVTSNIIYIVGFWDNRQNSKEQDQLLKKYYK